MKQLLSLLIILYFISCDSNIDIQSPNKSPYTTAASPIIKGEKLKNPYSVENMKIAYSQLKALGFCRSAIEIQATHYYVRFLPCNHNEYELLKKDTSLTLFPFPLDYELTEGELYTSDSLEKSEFCWLYTRVPIGYKSPIQNMEILDELFLPDIANNESTNNSNKYSSLLENEWYLLEGLSLKNSGINTSNTTFGQTKNKSSWTPKVTIKVYDDTRCINVPLEGVRVCARRWFNWEHCITDINGTGTMSDNFSGAVNYSIDWERDNWSINASYNGPKSSSNWDLTIGEGVPLNYLAAHIHMACMAYWNKHNNYGIKEPSSGWFWYAENLSVGGRDKIYIYPINKTGTSITDTNTREITIYRTKVGYPLTSCSHLFQTTIHELSHVSHVDLTTSDLDDVAKIISESWAKGVSFFISKDYYLPFQLIESDMQDMTIANIKSRLPYSPIVIDLIDDVNQRNTHNGSSSYLLDRVSGYTLGQIEQSLIGAKTLNDWKNKIKNLYQNDTEIYLDEYFEQYN